MHHMRFVAVMLACAACTNGQGGFNMVPVSDAGFIKDVGISHQRVQVKFDPSTAGRFVSVHPYNQCMSGYRADSLGSISTIEEGKAACTKFKDVLGNDDTVENNKFIDSSPVAMDVANGVVAMVFQGKDTMSKGKLVFTSTAGARLGAPLTVGYSPTDVKFILDQNSIKYIIVTNQGGVSLRSADGPTPPDADGSVTIIDVDGGDITTIGQETNVFDVKFSGTLAADIRRLRPGTTAAQDLEPTFVAGTDADMKNAFIVLTDNNALGIVDLDQRVWTKVFSAGETKRSEVPFDASDRDRVEVNGQEIQSGRRILSHNNLYSYRMPNRATTFTSGGHTYIITANQGPFTPWHIIEEHAAKTVVRLSDIPDSQVDASVVTNWAELKKPSSAGRLMVSAKDGKGADGRYTKFYSLGGRSFTVFKATATAITEEYDSRSDLEDQVAQEAPDSFNALPCSDSPGSAEKYCKDAPAALSGKGVDSQSAYSGPAPSAVSVVAVGPKRYALVSSYTTGGFFAYDLATPSAPAFYKYFSFREGQATDGDDHSFGKWGVPDFTFSNYDSYYPDKLRTSTNGPDLYAIRNGPAAMDVLAAEKSPSGYPLVAVMSTRSGSTQLYMLLPESCVIGKASLNNLKLTASVGNVLDPSAEFKPPEFGTERTAVARVDMKKKNGVTLYYKLYKKATTSLDWPGYRDCIGAGTACDFSKFVKSSSGSSQVYEGQFTSNVTAVPSIIRVAFSDRSTMCSSKAEGQGFFVSEHKPQADPDGKGGSGVTNVPQSPVQVSWMWSQLQ